ncbi:MAG: hypothetical protein ACRDH2_14150 [Anaerolineales bacterium]
MNPNTRLPKLALLIGIAVFSLLFVGSLARAAGNLQGLVGTPTAYVFMPAVYKQPTFTPTATSTRTPTPTTIPPTPSTLTGRLSLCNPARTVYTRTELVCVIETITNTNTFTLYYGLLGVNVVGPRSWFQVSWSNSGIGPNCTGPKNFCEGSWQDNIRGYDDTPGFKNTGTYLMFLGVCYSSEAVCRTSQGAWQNFLPGVTITITN